MWSISSLVLFAGLFAFSDGPFYLLHWLATSAGEQHAKPTHIVILGGGGYPGEQTLLRTWHAAQLAQTFPLAEVVVSQASDSMQENAAEHLRDELVMRGVVTSRIRLQTQARNTREEALLAYGLLGDSAHIRLVTAPEHMRRAVLSFEAVGFHHVSGHPAYSDPGIPDLRYSESALGGRDVPVPEVGSSTQLRYRFWNHLHYELLCLREFVALLWYRLHGWC
jgi:uncharacterized SAM-binding protein YcdF (DUF218 family)